MRTAIYLLMVLTLNVLCGANCEGPAGCISAIGGFGYKFEIPIQLSPARDTFRVGDTITIRSRFSHDVWERTTGRTFELRDWKFNPVSFFYKIDADTVTAVQRTLADNFIVLFDTIKYDYHYMWYTSGNVGLIGEYSYNGEEYDLAYQLIAVDPGLYLHQFGLNFFYFDPDQYFPGKCRSDQSEGYVLMNDGADNNAHLLAASPDPNYNYRMTSRLDDLFHRFGGYCFVVVE